MRSSKVQDELLPGYSKWEETRPPKKGKKGGSLDGTKRGTFLESLNVCLRGWKGSRTRLKTKIELGRGLWNIDTRSEKCAFPPGLRAMRQGKRRGMKIHLVRGV